MYNFSHLSEYETDFTNKEEMKEAISKHLEAHSMKLNTNQRRVIEYLALIAGNNNGVCHVYRQTIADSLQVSPVTISRAFRVLKKLGIIKVQATAKKSVRGGRGASIVSFCAYDDKEDDKQDDNLLMTNDVSHSNALDGENRVTTTSTSRKTLVNNLLTDQQINEVYKSFPNLSKALFNRIVMEFNRTANQKPVRNAVAYFKGMVRNSIRHIEKRSQEGIEGYTKTLKADNPLVLFGRIMEREGSLNVTL
ncbi:helix-turn-helix domain-containing protein [Listeria monocytogenes]|nr:helix-turn-helix domain-containing protein [Listeria monocytogenes]